MGRPPVASGAPQTAFNSVGKPVKNSRAIKVRQFTGEATVKITIDIDCTPAEARQFIGLPDLEPLQRAAMQEIEKRMMAEFERYSPEGLVKTWLTPLTADWLQELTKKAKK
jgi:hypothetical protein